ncbi:hypothetical protein BH23CHL8_BH23CHL8_15570 [soil metagenome]
MTRRKPQRATPPNVLGQGPLVAAQGLHLGVVVIVRNEAPYLEEWLCYHLALGVEHVLLYDNGSDDELRQVVERYVNHGLLTLLHWPLPGGQLDAYSHALRFFGPSVDWLAFIDVDEFIVPLADDDIPTFLARFPDAADIRVPRVDFGYSGHRQPPAGLAIEAYTGVANVFGRSPDQAPRVKTILQPRGVSAVGIHTATLADIPVARDERPVPTRSVRQGARDLAQVNHYYTRSFEEFEAKRFRGSATGRLPRPPVPFDLPTLAQDTSAHRFVERTRAMLERMRSLEPRPYHYGSQLALSQFPRSNDLGLFSEFTLANIAVGAPELVREPLIRLENLYAGTGFVGDLGATDHVAQREDISGSIHLGPLLDHVRGRLDAVLRGPGSAATEGSAWRVTTGSLEDVGGAWRLSLADGAAELTTAIPGDGMRRCHALGFLLATRALTTLEVKLSHDDGPASAPVEVTLERATTYAGLVELDARPRFADEVSVRLRAADAPELFDLFLVSYG